MEATTGAALAPGARLGEYVVATEIASGGMGVVYLARREGTGDRELYAIKVVHDDLARRFPELGELLRREASLAAQIHHPCAVTVLEVGEDGGRPFAVMPYVEGGTLADLIDAGVAGPDLVAAVMVDALRGLHAAHVAEDDRGRPLRLVHRDVCPENILVGVDGRARIADFGLAVAAAHTLDAERGSGRGHWAFMAPEQLRGGPVDRRSDVFSAGVTLFFALTGTELFRGPSVAATMQNVAHMPVPRPSEVGSRPPAALDTVCLRAVERDPEVRFSTAEAMASALREASAAAGALATREQVAIAVRDAQAARLAERSDALAALEPAAAPRSLPLPPPNPRDSAAEMLLPDEIAQLAAELDGEDDDDPDGPATSLYRPEEYGELEDVEIIFASDGDSRAGDDRSRADDATDVDPPVRLAAGSGEHAPWDQGRGVARDAPPQPAAGAEWDEVSLVVPKSSLLARLWSRIVRAFRPGSP